LTLDFLAVRFCGWRTRVLLVSSAVVVLLVTVAVTVATVSVVIASTESSVEELSGQEKETATNFDLLVVLLEEVEGLVSVLSQDVEVRRELIDELREVVRGEQEGDAQEAQE